MLARRAFFIVCACVGTLFTAFTGQAEVGELRLAATTDLHCNVLNYDYYKGATTDAYGTVKVATLIKRARKESMEKGAAFVLIDNGDTLQGAPLCDLWAQTLEGEHPMFKILNRLQYDIGTVGNHEFNFGLEYLQRSLSSARFPVINSNIYFDDHDGVNGRHYFVPSVVIEKLVGKGAKATPVKVGFFGVAPLEILNWDRDKLLGKVVVKSIRETALESVAKLKREGAQVIVALVHEGVSVGNVVAKVPGVDAMILGHSHLLLPNGVTGEEVQPDFGRVPAVMAGYWGSHLGIIDLKLELATMKVISGTPLLQPISKSEGGRVIPLVDADQELLALASEDHQNTIRYLDTPIGESSGAIHSYFSQIFDDPSLRLINSAQRAYVEKFLGKNYPLLSAASPFKVGGQGDDYYTDIPAGAITIKHMADLYVFPNSVKALLLNGDEVREWLEMSAGQFNTIDPNRCNGEVKIINDHFKSYNYDVIAGVTYQIDISKPPRYSVSGQLVNTNSHRIVDLKYAGVAVTGEQKFIVVTNNYRAGGGGNFPGLSSSKVVVDLEVLNRDTITAYVKEQGKITPAPAEGASSWSIRVGNGVGNKCRPIFTSAKKSLEYRSSYSKIVDYRDDGAGKVIYTILFN
ncbi:MAG: bifunctional 2',3'-cyclic-nucleotide 2'-phosphodiesterase/3'-nucleotidase [Oligoflexia bacterium]|nr:bifunctional 2',3'-cyclic-nucleotide 2'-phosphodiesterase/3'-nucleotidase [Oligoflexia bacterium]